MGTTETGRVVTEATIENLEDLILAERGDVVMAAVRRVEVSDALVDTGATLLSLPSRIIRELGLKRRYSRPVRTAVGVHETSVFAPVRLTIQGRDCTVDVTEVPDEIPVLVGQIPLEQLDFVVDPRQQKLIGNPAHGGEQMFELY